MANSGNDKKIQLNTSTDSYEDRIYKIIVVGDIGTGKTSVIRRYVHNTYTELYKSTIGVDFALKTIQWSPYLTVRFQLWDIAGQERFGNMTRVYYKDARAAIIVFDITRSSTYEAIEKWKKDIDNKVLIDDHRLPVLLLANKYDLKETAEEKYTDEFMNNLCKKLDIDFWAFVSAKNNTGIEDAFYQLGQEILKQDKNNEGLKTFQKISNVETVKLVTDDPSKKYFINCCN